MCGSCQRFSVGPLAQFDERGQTSCPAAWREPRESERHASREVGLCGGLFPHKRAEDGKEQKYVGPLAQLVRAEDS